MRKCLRCDTVMVEDLTVMVSSGGYGIPAIVGTALILPVYISSVRTKKHTLPQLIGGSAIPAVVLLMIVFFKAVLMN